jgi:isoleucyl-tRNA synthetase
VVLTPSRADLEFLKRYESQLPMLFIVSEVEISQDSSPSGTAPEDGKAGISVVRAGGVKCERCWRYVPVVSSDPTWAGLCERCQGVLAETVNG